MSSHLKSYTYDEFAVGMSQGKLKVSWNDEKVIQDFDSLEISQHNKKLKTLIAIFPTRLMQKYEESKSWFWIVSLLMIFTPIRFLVVLSVLIGAIIYYFKKICTSCLEEEILKNKEAFENLQNEGYFHIWSKEDDSSSSEA